MIYKLANAEWLCVERFERCSLLLNLDTSNELILSNDAVDRLPVTAVVD